jgi:hypothetical protein
MLDNVGTPPNKTVGLPGAQGVTVAGTQGIGVNAPIAAFVAAATCGLAIEEHIPKEGILTNGLLSIILAAGILLVITRFCGNTMSDDGATPKEQVIEAPIQTCSGITIRFYWIYYILFGFR